MTGGAVGARYSPASHGGGTSRINDAPGLTRSKEISKFARIAEAMSPAAALLLAAGILASAQTPEEEHARLIEAARRNALAFTHSLPDFFCSETLRRFESRPGAADWRARDTLEIELSYSQGEDDYELISVNDQPALQSYDATPGAITHGEFGAWLHTIFDPASAAGFRWERSEPIGARSTAVFSYRVSSAKSDYHLYYRDGGPYHSAHVGYSGDVWIDQASQRVLRVWIQAEGIPEHFPVRQTSHLLGYDFASIAGREYLLPAYAETRVATVKEDFRNQMEFLHYRKFEATATLRGEGRMAAANASPAANEARVPAATIERLEFESGVPQRSARAAAELNQFHDESELIPAPAPPDAPAVAQTVAEARRLASAYLESLAPFSYTETFTVSTKPPRRESWEPVGSLTARADHSASGEAFRMIAPDRAARADQAHFETALHSSAWNFEYTRLLENVLAPSAPAEFRWYRGAMLRGAPVEVYFFVVPQASSHYLIRRGFSTVAAAQRGFLYVDPKTDRLLRIFAEAAAIPPGTALRYTSALLDFAPSGGRLLPLREVLRVDSQDLATRYESSYQIDAR